LVSVFMTPLVNHDYIIEVKDIHSMVAANDNDLTEDDHDTHIIIFEKAMVAENGRMINEPRVGRLPATGVRDEIFMDWLLT
jgi:hypothetical protein